jgi:glycosyltransferase involved in cell wall biosynthesis
VKRLLLVYLYCNLGGVTSVWKQRMPALRREDWSVDAIFQMDYGGSADLGMSGISEVAIAGREMARAVARAIGSRTYDVVTLVDAPELIRPVRDSFDGKLIYEIHTSISTVLQKNSVQELSDCDLILVPSTWSRRWVLAHFPGLHPDLVQICPNIVSDREFYRDGADRRIGTPPELLWVGKLDRVKNWREAARIAGLVTERNIRFTMVTGGLVDQVHAQELLTEWMADGVADRSRWLHNLPLRAMADLYRQAARSGGAVLSTSLSESFCLVAHEALRCGLPVVATRVGACPDIVQHQVSGLLYDPGDDAVAAGHLDRLLADRELRNVLMNGAAIALDEFDGVKLADIYIGLLEGPAVNDDHESA